MKEVTWFSGGLVFFYYKKIWLAQIFLGASPFAALDTYWRRDREREQKREKECNFSLSPPFVIVVS